MNFGIDRIEIAEGGDCAPQWKGWLCIAKVYGCRNGDLNRGDYQGWMALIRTPAFQWFPEGHMWYGRATWAQRVICIRHVFLTPPRRSLNGFGWQGWRWSAFWNPIEN